MIKPYYEDTKNGLTIYNADCLDVMREMEDKSVDLVLTDPPYGIGLSYDIYNDTEQNWYNLMAKVLPEVKRVAIMTIMPSCQINRLGWVYTNHPPNWLIAWYKGSPGTLSFVGFNDWEALLVYGKNKGIQMHDHFYCHPTPFEFGHPCPKPIGWAVWLIERASKRQDLILDLFCGSGTTCVVAKMLGRKCIGIEISEKYCEIAVKRLKNTPPPLDIDIPINKLIKRKKEIKDKRSKLEGI